MMLTTQNTLERYRPLLDPTEFAELQAAVQRPLLPAIRINTLKIGVDEARRMWPEWYGWQVQPIPFCPTGWQIASGGDNLSRTLEYRMGFYYIQDAASMLPAEMFRFDEPRPLILDMAASPGGKTTHLACRIDDTGLIIANDTSGGRIGALRSNLQDWGMIGMAITNYPGERLGNWFPDTFDAVLLDAPCSGESLRTAERRKTRPVSAKERQQLQRRQIQLLTSAFHAVKPSGQVVYATCTLAPEEDEAVLDALLRLYPRQAVIEPVDQVLPTPAPGLISDGEHEFDARLHHAARLWPHRYDTSGFFAALIRKREAVPVEAQTPPARTLAQAGLERLSQREESEIIEQMRQAYGFDLHNLIERQALTLWARQKSMYAIPEQFLARFADLPCAAIGMLIGERSEGFTPSHEFIARFSRRFTSSRLRLSADQIEKWLAGYDLRGAENASYPAGTVVLMEDDRGRFLGRGKVLRERIRNMLPKR
ncbi:MAG TPA: NOL1/NOP2/sun family putative RNA methylase [Anaerolineae bacterium]|nr:NOL1/NOP2/sun family putative RNA methylase [Anaerolineae bacterium]